MAELIKIAIWVEDLGAQGTMYQMGSRYSMGRGNFEGEGTAHYKVQGHSAVSCAKTTEPTEMPFGIWTQVGPEEACIRWECILAPPGEYHWTMCGDDTSCCEIAFDHLLLSSYHYCDNGRQPSEWRRKTLTQFRSKFLKWLSKSCHC